MIKVPSEKHPQFIGDNSNDGVRTVRGSLVKSWNFEMKVSKKRVSACMHVRACLCSLISEWFGDSQGNRLQTKSLLNPTRMKFPSL